MFLSGNAPKPAPFPILTDGLLNRAADGAPAAPAGQLSPHGLVPTEFGVARFDEVVGLGFVLVLAPGISPAQLSKASRDFLVDLDVHVAALSTALNGPNAVVDLQGKYTSYMAAAGLQALLIRPDFYIFGGARDAASTDRQIDGLRAQMTKFGFSRQGTQALQAAAQ